MICTMLVAWSNDILPVTHVGTGTMLYNKPA